MQSFRLLRIFLFLLIGSSQLIVLGQVTITTNANHPVIVKTDSIFIPQLNRSRRIWICLPSNYEDAIGKRYPVMYMQDGQNLFDSTTSFAQEWCVDESLTRMQKKGEGEIIVVGIDNGGSNRMNEYSPFVNPKFGGGEGKEYMRFIVETLKPYIDSVYRTLSDQPHTAIGGSSMGALISLYGAITYPNIFSKVAAFSPSLWFSDSLFDYAAKKQIFPRINVYFLGGRKEGPHMVSNIERMDSILNSKGAMCYTGYKAIKDDGEHKEWFWKREFPEAIHNLFYDVSDAYRLDFEGRLNRNTKLVPNPADEFTEIRTWAMQEIQVLDKDGNEVFKVKVNNPYYKLETGSLKNGMYYVVINFGSNKISKTLQVEHK